MGWGPTVAPTITEPMSQTEDTPPIGPTDQEQASEVAITADSQPRATDVLNTTSEQDSSVLPETEENRGSSWLSPWSWYGSYNHPPTAPAPNPTEAAMDGIEIDSQAQAQSPSNAEADVKEARTTLPTTALLEPANPIQSSIATNVSGWASFFSSKTLLAKRITDIEHREENTMEVMEIDDGDEETAALVATSEARTGNDAVRETQVAKISPAPPRSPSPSTKPNAKSDKKPDETKGRKRVSVSPAPSKGSGRASPRVPAPPNLVLPTWEDTFRSPPRSNALQPEIGSAFTRTVRFVSGMLFARDDGTSTTGKGKAPSKDHGSFTDFGRDLPRSWDVIGGNLDGDILRGCRRVVVIGIHGWFPGTSADDSNRIRGNDADQSGLT